jgi:aminopeptidase N
MLRSLVGDEKFFTILSTYFNRHKFKLVELEDFIDSAEEISGIELDWFFDQWLWDTGYTTYSLQDARAWKTSEGWKLSMNVTQSNPSFKMPVPTEIILVNNSTKRARLWMGDEQGTFVLDLNLKPSRVVIDPSDDILGAEQCNKKDVEIVSNKQ